jgi:hypothetical protein
MARALRSTIIAVAVLLPLSGCVVSYRADAPTRAVVGAAVIVGIVAADGFRYYRVEPDGSRTPIGYVPPADPARRINVQDCTRPIDPEAGNLLCR